MEALAGWGGRLLLLICCIACWICIVAQGLLCRRDNVSNLWCHGCNRGIVGGRSTITSGSG